MARAGEDGFFDDAGLPTGDGWEQTELPRPKGTLFSLRINGIPWLPVSRGRPGAGRSRRGSARATASWSGPRREKTLAKELAAITARSVSLSSINPAYEPRTLPCGDIIWMGRVLWVSQ